MGKAARAIIVENNNLLVMHRNKQGSQYYTLVGGRAAEGESLEHALVREVKEETGLDVTNARLVFTEMHPEPYNEQYIYICQIGPHTDVVIQESSEEAGMNKIGINMHRPLWVNIKALDRLAFRTPQLQEAIIKGLKKGWPKEPTKL
jgi:ADP-ribose pyrophosphatase YjhB (NUDIX family)